MTRELVADFVKQRAKGPIACKLRIAIDQGTTTVLFGPSGVGKSTILRCLAGLDVPEQGTIRFGEEVWLDSRRATSPQKRRIGYMAQAYSLFPHMTVGDNIAYGLGRMDPAERQARSKEILAMMMLDGLGDRMPNELSGGEQQRVALGRALAPRPRLLLLDEPMSALDAPTRDQVRQELRNLLRRAQTPTLLVTHDRTDALTLGESMAVMIDGAIRQSGNIEGVFRNPADDQVARLLGVENVAQGTVVEASHSPWAVRVGSTLLYASPIEPPASEVFVCIRAHDVLIATGEPGHTSARNQLPARIVDVRSEGSTVRLSLDAGFPLIATVTTDSATELGLRVDTRVTALIKAPRVQLVPRSAGRESG
jgi:molybdate transport system ATP-binding protein